MPRTRGGISGTQSRGRGRGLPRTRGVGSARIQGPSMPDTSTSEPGEGTHARGRSRGRTRRLPRGRGRGRGLNSSTLPDWLFMSGIENLPVGVPLEVPLTIKRRRAWCPQEADEVDLSEVPVLEEAASIEVSEEYSAVPSPAQSTVPVPEEAAPMEVSIASSVPSPAQFFECGGSGPNTPRSGLQGLLSSAALECEASGQNSHANNVPSPVAFVECGGSGQSTPRSSLARRLTSYPLAGRCLREAEIEHAINFGSEDEESDDGETNPFIPRGMRIYLDADDAENVGTEPNFQWPLQPSSPQALPLPPSSSTSFSPSEPPAFEESVGREVGPTDLYNFVWQPLPQPPIPPDHRRETFKGRAGSTIDPTTPYEAFSAIWDPAIIYHIVAETNKYAEQLLLRKAAVGSLGDHSRMADWCPIDANDLMTYLGVVMAMSIVQKNVLTEFWSRDGNIFSTPHFAATMPRNKFQRISRCLHFNDNTYLSSRQLSSAQAKLYKLEPIVGHLNKAFKEVYKLGQNISLDESLTLWKGWLNIKQCIPNKAAKVGIKTYEVCESKSGYLYQFEIHAKAPETQEPVIDSRMSGFVPRLVLRLLDGLEEVGHTVWMDNYYNSPALARSLKSKGFDCVGTLRTNRALVPTQLNQIKVGIIPMRKGDLVGCTSGDVDLFVWSDTAKVAFVSTYHGMAVHHCSIENKTKPILVRDYNICMGGVDLKDQVLSSYPIERKRQMVWYKKLFYRLLNVSVFNASIVLNSTRSTGNQPSLSQRAFRTALVLEILERHTTSQRPVPRPMPAVEAVTRLLPSSSVEHFTVPFETVEGKHEKKRRTCVLCKKRVRSHCPKCNVALCFSPCAQQYHLSV